MYPLIISFQQSEFSNLNAMGDFGMNHSGTMTNEPKPRFSVAWINVVCAIFSSIGAFIFGFDSGM
jgi:hypothetical protein